MTNTRPVIHANSKRRPSPILVSSAVGLDTADASCDYILLYRGDRAALARSLDSIQRTAAVILAAIADS